MLEKGTLEPSQLQAILRETTGSLTVRENGPFETSVWLYERFLHSAESRPMGPFERIEQMPVPVKDGVGQEVHYYPYRIARWQAVLGGIAAELPERCMAQRMVKAARKRGFALGMPRKWR